MTTSKLYLAHHGELKPIKIFIVRSGGSFCSVDNGAGYIPLFDVNPQQGDKLLSLVAERINRGETAFSYDGLVKLGRKALRATKRQRREILERSALFARVPA